VTPSPKETRCRDRYITVLSRSFPLALLLGFLLLGQALHAKDSFQSGIEAYQQGDYAGAEIAFQREVDQRPTGAAYHNLALAQYRLGRLDAAVWQLERALQADPLNEDYHFKLAAVRQQLGLPAAAPAWWQTAARLLPPSAWIWWLCFGGWALLAGLLLPKISRSRFGLLLKVHNSAAAGSIVLAGSALAVSAYSFPSGVALGDEPIPLRHAPASGGPAAGSVRPGERIFLQDRHMGFARVKTESETIGWIKWESVGPL
jgi:tetratricopeptide (TPR) repeat protein